MQVLSGADVQVEQPGEGQVDRSHLVEIDAIGDAAQGVEIVLAQGERCGRPEIGPLGAIEGEVPARGVSHTRNPTLAAWIRPNPHRSHGP